MRAKYPTAKTIVVISDSGIPWGTGGDGSPVRAGYLRYNAPGSSVTPSYIEDFFADAWGLFSTHPFGVGPVSRPEAHGPMWPQQAKFLGIVGSSASGDRFGFISADQDWVMPLYTHVNGAGGAVRTIASGLTDFNTFVVAPSSAKVKLSIVSSTDTFAADLRPWRQHHTFLIDDVSSWGAPGSPAHGSGVSAFLATLPL